MGGNTLLIGILALQGDVREHRKVLEALGAEVVEVRSASQLDGLSGLVLPGGESSVIDKLCRRFGLDEPIQQLLSRGVPVLATCAGMILLAKDIEGGISGQKTFGAMDMTVKRNAFGGQRESFDTQVEVKGLEGGPVDVSFIRAPVATRVGEGLRVLAQLPDSSVVAVDDGQCLALAFHPEVSGDKRLHEVFLDRARQFYKENLA